MAALYHKPQEAIISELGDLIYQTPAGSYQTTDEYLTGNVRKKLVEAKEAARTNPAFLRNVQALENVIPTDIEAVDIAVKPGAPWIPDAHVADFIHHIAESDSGTAFFEKYQTKWMINDINPTPAAQTQWATERTSVKDVLNAALNGSTVTVRDKIDRDTYKLNQEATDAANEKVGRVKREWDRWLWENDDRRQELSRLYNDTFNTNVLRHYDGAHLNLPGKVGDDIIALRPHQKNFVWRVLQSGTALADHTVGAGKTFAMVATIVEMRRMGRAKKNRWLSCPIIWWGNGLPILSSFIPALKYWRPQNAILKSQTVNSFLPVWQRVTGMRLSLPIPLLAKSLLILIFKNALSNKKST